MYRQESYEIQIILVLVFLLLLLPIDATHMETAHVVFVVIRFLRPLPMSLPFLLDNDLPDVDTIVRGHHHQSPTSPPPSYILPGVNGRL